MPISVSCPSCSVTFKTKDEYAGKRAKCPKCGNPITIPVVDTVLMPPPPKATAPVAARPVVASKPKPAPVRVADDDAPVSPKRKRGADDEDDKPRAKKGKEEDDAPKSKRKRGDDADDDKPRRRRRDDDDEPKKKSKALPIILGIVGGLLLLCGGGCAGVWFGVIAPAAEQAKKRHSEQQAELDRWEKEWNKPPANPDWNPNPGPGPATGPNPGDDRPPIAQGAIDERPVVTLTPDEAARDMQKYGDKHIVMSVVAERDYPAGTTMFEMSASTASGRAVSFGGSVRTVAPIKKGETFDVYGFLQKSDGDDTIHMLDGVLAKPTGAPVPVSSLLNEYLADPEKAHTKYREGGPPLMTGVVTQKDIDWLLLDGSTVDGKAVGVRVRYAAVRIPPGVNVGDKVLFSGRIETLFDDPFLKRRMLMIDDGRPHLTYRPPGPPSPIPYSPPPPFDPKSIPTRPVATLTATELGKDHAKYTGKWVAVTGKAKFGSEARTPPGRQREQSGWFAVELEQTGPLVRFIDSSSDESVKAKDEVEVWCKVKGLSKFVNEVEVEDCLVVKPALEKDAIKLSQELATDEKLVEKYENRQVKVTGVLLRMGTTFLMQGPQVNGKSQLIRCDGLLHDIRPLLRPGDTVTFVGYVRYSKDVGLSFYRSRVYSITR